MLVLKLLTERELTTYDGRLFHKLIILCVKSIFAYHIYSNAFYSETK